jgi:hypothetical protein
VRQTRSPRRRAVKSPRRSARGLGVRVDRQLSLERLAQRSKMRDASKMRHQWRA